MFIRCPWLNYKPCHANFENHKIPFMGYMEKNFFWALWLSFYICSAWNLCPQSSVEFVVSKIIENDTFNRLKKVTKWGLFISLNENKMWREKSWKRKIKLSIEVYLSISKFFKFDTKCAHQCIHVTNHHLHTNSPSFWTKLEGFLS